MPDEKYGFVINVQGDVSLNDRHLKSIPVKFNNITRHFYCYKNKLTSLKGCPEYVGGNFYCYDNQLINLEHFPKFVGNKIYCYNNSMLGNLQDIKDFHIIYEEINRIKKSKYLFHNLSQELGSKNNNKRIKI